MVLVVAVVAALAFGSYRAVSDGRFRGTHRVRGAESTPGDDPNPPAQQEEASVLADTPWADELGERATLLQFSSAFCAPCRTTRRVLEQVSATESGIAHVEVDAEHHLDVVRRFGILRTPTTLIIDASGREVTRAMGVPAREQVLAALEQLR